jgi:hypothetical protein
VGFSPDVNSCGLLFGPQAALNGQVYELLTVFMDWISDCHLSKVEPEEPGVDGGKPPAKPSQRSDIQEKCVKVGFSDLTNFYLICVSVVFALM